MSFLIDAVRCCDGVAGDRAVCRYVEGVGVLWDGRLLYRQAEGT